MSALQPEGRRRQGTSNGASGGGGQSGFLSASLQYGGRTLDLTLDRPRRLLSIQGKPLSITDDSNVVLVDGADTASGPRVVKMLSLPAEAEAVNPKNSSLAAFFRRSSELVLFLRCEGGPDGARDSPFARIVCNDLRGR